MLMGPFGKGVATFQGNSMSTPFQLPSTLLPDDPQVSLIGNQAMAARLVTADHSARNREVFGEQPNLVVERAVLEIKAGFPEGGRRADPARLRWSGRCGTSGRRGPRQRRRSPRRQ